MSIYVNAGLDETARARLALGLPDRPLRWASPVATMLVAGGADEALRDATIVFGQPDPMSLLGAKQLKLVQLSSAGWARYDRQDLRAAFARRGTALCSASSVFADPVADHALAMILSLLRRLPEAEDEQRGDRRWLFTELRAGSRLLSGETVLLLGYGAIAQKIAARLRPFGCKIVGYRRRPRGDEEIPVVDHAGLGAALAGADHVVDLLPEGAATHHFVDAAFLSQCKRGSRFYNLGRGDTVDQGPLIEALRSGRLDAAFLDVTTPEPLPPTDPLWTTPRLFLTPHTAGGHLGEQRRTVDHFLSNLAAFEAGRALADRVY